MNLAQQLAQIIEQTPVISDRIVIRRAIAGVTDYFASSLQAHNDADAQKLLAWLTDEGGHQRAWLVGRKQLATARQAALFNGFQAHCLDYDDVHADVRGHPSAVILSALFASVRLDKPPTNIDGRRFLTAYVIGIEVMALLGKSVNPYHYEKGWHATATLGGIAATVAICYLYQEPFLTEAFALAATQAAGMRLLMGTPIKFLHAGLAAQQALQTVEWLRAGLTADQNFLDENLGFLAIYGQNNEQLTLQQWAKPWKIVEPGLWFKTYSYCSAAAYIADAGQLLYQQQQFKPDNIANITLCFAPPKSDAALIYQSPTTGEQGRFSAEYILALTLLGYPLDFERFSSEPIADNIVSLMQKMQRHYQTANTCHKPSNRYVVVEIEFMCGNKLSQRIDFPKGSPQNPYTNEQMRLKLLQAVGDEQKTDNLLDDIEQLANGLSLDQFLQRHWLTL